MRPMPSHHCSLYLTVARCARLVLLLEAWIFKNLQLRSIPLNSVVNASTINLICNLLSSEDYVSIAEQLSQDSDVKNLVDFMLHLLRDGCLPNLDETLGIKPRARRLMFKIITRIPVIPPSLIVTGVNMPEKRDYIGSGGFGRIFKAELQGVVVALKVLFKSDSDVVSSACCYYKIIVDCGSNRLFVERHLCGDPSPTDSCYHF
jgi:hypothetical protein